MNIYKTVIAIIVIIIVSILVILVDNYKMRVGVLLAALALLSLIPYTELFTVLEKPDNNVIHSRRSSINTSPKNPGILKTDIDPILQQKNNLDFGTTSNIGNEDVVDVYLNGYINPKYKLTNTGQLNFDEPDARVSYVNPINPRGMNIDTLLARRRQFSDSLNKRAIDGAVRSTKNIFTKYLDRELRENETRDWWDVEDIEMYNE